jgi:hypothetical protein
MVLIIVLFKYVFYIFTIKYLVVLAYHTDTNISITTIMSTLIFKMTKYKIEVCFFIYLALPTRAGSPHQHMPITVGPFYLTHPVNFPCGRKPEYPGKTHDFRQSVDFTLFA